jgi:hypothetical protein
LWRIAATFLCKDASGSVLPVPTSPPSRYGCSCFHILAVCRVTNLVSTSISKPSRGGGRYVVNSLFSGGQDLWTEGRGCRCAPFLFFALIRGCTLYHCPSVGRDRSPVDVFICCGFEDLLIPDQGPRSLLFPGFRISGAEFDVILL